MTSTPPAEGVRSSTTLRLTVLTVLLAQFLGVLDGLIVSVALPSMSLELGIAPGDVHWVLNAYSVAFAGLLPLGGKAADILGRRRTFLVGQALLSLGSLLGALASNGVVVLVARVMQALGAAISTPAAISILADSFHDEKERARAFGLLPIGGGVGWVSAGLFGGLLTAFVGWRGVFLVNLPVSAAAIVLALFCFPRSGPRSAGDRIDWSGAALLILALGCAVFTLGRVEQVGVASLDTLVGVVVAAVLGLLFVLRARRGANPFLRLELLRRGGVPGAAVLGLVLPVGFVATQFLGSIYLQNVLGLRADLAGYAFLPLAATPLLVTTAVGRFYPRFGVARSVSFGFLLAAVGMALAAVAPTQLGVGWLLIGFGLIGIGLTIVYVPLAVASVSGIDSAEYGAASAIFSTANQVGGSMALAVLSTVALAASDTSAPGTRYGANGLAAGLAAAAVLALFACVAAIPLLRRVDRLSQTSEPSDAE
ncbi:MFS transporter [Actinophytocola sediminis]